MRKEERVLLQASVWPRAAGGIISLLLSAVLLLFVYQMESGGAAVLVLILAAWLFWSAVQSFRRPSDREIVITEHELRIPAGRGTKHINLLNLQEVRYMSRTRLKKSSPISPDHQTFIEFVSKDGETMDTLEFPYFEQKAAFREFLVKLERMKPDLVLQEQLLDFRNGNDRAVHLNRPVPFWVYAVLGGIVTAGIVFGIDWLIG